MDGLTDPFVRLVRSLLARDARFAVIGVWGANYYAHSGDSVFTTRDRDLFLPIDPENLLRVWEACDATSLTLWCGNEPLDSPRDRFLARAVAERLALTTARDDINLQVDLSLVMAGFSFDEIWRRRRIFVVNDVEVPVASLRDIVSSKANAGREKDRLFLATHAEALKNMMGLEPPSGRE